MTPDLILKVELSVTYLLNSVDPEDMQRILYKAIDSAIQDGMLTSDTDAEVLEYTYDVTT